MAKGGQLKGRMKKRAARAEAGAPESVMQPEFLEDLAHWAATDPKMARKVLDFVQEVMRTPMAGRGKPEPLKHVGPGVWSRRLTREHRLTYLVRPDRVDFLQCRYHY